MIIRFDDICLNTNMEPVWQMADHAMHLGHDVWFCVSLVCHAGAENERVHPKILDAQSDHRNFYRADRVGLPDSCHRINGVKICSHGLVHVDHRLLGYEAQEMSILTSCSLLDTRTFVPPFNKWNRSTEAICREHRLHLVKFEEGWKSMEHNKLSDGGHSWYLHPNGFTPDAFDAWLNGGTP